MGSIDESANSLAAANEHAAQESTRPVLVWDLPTRIFHWTLVACFFSALATGDSDRFRDLHVFFGYVVLGLICFRIFWGLAGSRYARFKAFPCDPRAAMTYAAEVIAARAQRYVGHNPAGSVAIYLLLALALVICVVGIVVLGAEESQGIFRTLSNRPLGDFAKGLHESLAWLMFAVVGAHIGGVVIESVVHRENLAKAMFTGRKVANADEGIGSNHQWLALVLLTCVASSSLWLIHWRLTDIPGLQNLPYVGRQLPDNTTWRESCGNCHGPFHPTLLPARSWAAQLDRPDDHFGLAWQFDAKRLAEIRTFLMRNSAETEMTEAAYRINRSIPADVTPLRITETPFWIEKHSKIDNATWSSPAVHSKSACQACHRDAMYGTFDDAAIRLPSSGAMP